MKIPVPGGEQLGGDFKSEVGWTYHIPERKWRELG